MDKRSVLKVAVNAPLSTLFDYLPPSRSPAGVIGPGCRVRVPFGRREETGLVFDLESSSTLPRSKLRRALTLIDHDPLFGPDELKLLRFASDYYHHPIGEVVAAALPLALRQGKPLDPVVSRLALTAAGQEVEVESLAGRAPRQAELLTALGDADSLTFAELDELQPGWRRVRKRLLDKGFVEVLEAPAEAHAFAAVAEPVPGPPLNRDQSAALSAMQAEKGFSVALLHGVTGSGKTEVYLHRIAAILSRGQQVLILVPEIGLTPQLVKRLRQRLGVEPAVLHSSLTDSARLAAWRAARSGDAPLVLGTRSAVFAPLAAPGLIIVDEEHDSSLKQQDGFRYSARDLAVIRGKQLGIPVILGSATPSLESLKRCNDGAYLHLELPQRAGGAAPPHMRLVDLGTQNPVDGLSEPAIAAIRTTLAEAGQVLVFLNRRGFAPTLICTACGGIAECSRCDSRLTVHAADGRLRCHHCGASRPLEPVCLNCGGTSTPLGLGTERIEASLRWHFPDQSIARIDSDSVRLRGTMDKALADATAGRTGILVGTQMLSKGHHFPNLTLVVVINADQGLFSTDFRGGERLAQSLVQVAGRAGREQKQGQVIIQTAFPQHPFWRHLVAGGYEKFAALTLAERERTAWPPFSRLALLRAAAHERRHARAFLDHVRRRAESAAGDGVRILGPVSAPMERRAGRYRAQLLFQSANRQSLHRLLTALRPEIEGAKSARRVRWSLDVDPIELF